MPNAKGTRRRLTGQEVEEFRNRYLAGERVPDVAAEMGCSESHGWSVVRGLVGRLQEGKVVEAQERISFLDVESKGWIAGIIDGEGWIGLARNKKAIGPRVSVAATDERMADELERMCGGNTCWKKPTGKNSRKTKVWDLYTLPDVLAFCRKIGPLLRLKGEQAELVAEFCERRIGSGNRKYSQRELELRDAVMRLNRKGRK